MFFAFGLRGIRAVDAVGGAQHTSLLSGLLTGNCASPKCITGQPLLSPLQLAASTEGTAALSGGMLRDVFCVRSSGDQSC